MSIQERFEEELDQLRRMRDELKLQVRLGQAEAHDLWEDLEKRWQHIEGRAQVIGDASKESLEDIEDAGRQLVDEIRDGYKKIKELL